MLKKSFISSIFDKTNLEAICLDILNVAERKMIATFLDDKGGSIAYSVGKEITLQDALNATQNNHFAPSIVVLTGVKNEQAQAEKTPETIESTPEPKLGKHTIEDIIAKHKISSAKLTDLLT